MGDWSFDTAKQTVMALVGTLLNSPTRSARKKRQGRDMHVDNVNYFGGETLANLVAPMTMKLHEPLSDCVLLSASYTRRALITNSITLFIAPIDDRRSSGFTPPAIKS